MKLQLSEPFKSLWKNKDPFTEVEQLQGKIYRQLNGRKTLQTKVAGAHYFVKIHRGIGWIEILKNLITFKLPVLGAEQELKAITRLTELNIPTMTAVAFGKKGHNPAKQYSFIITQDLSPTISLEDYCMNWSIRPPKPKLKRALIRRVAEMVGTMHRAGVNHRDCYICHFLLHIDQPITPEDFKLSIIDLHRVQIRSHLPSRWRDKDLASLYFSALDIGLTQRDKMRFLIHYFQQPLTQCLAEHKTLLTHLQIKTDKLNERKQRYGDAL